MNKEVDLKKYAGFLILAAVLFSASNAFAGEADLKVPDLSTVPLIFNLNGRLAPYAGDHCLCFWRFLRDIPVWADQENACAQEHERYFRTYLYDM